MNTFPEELTTVSLISYLRSACTVGEPCKVIIFINVPFSLSLLFCGFNGTKEVAGAFDPRGEGATA
jgi:hypothetical protein